jgi:hypothetical protein
MCPSAVAQKKLWLVTIFDAAAANSPIVRAKFMSITASTVPCSFIQKDIFRVWAR